MFLLNGRVQSFARVVNYTHELLVIIVLIIENLEILQDGNIIGVRWSRTKRR